MLVRLSHPRLCRYSNLIFPRPIHTYNGRATLKPSVNPNTHTIVHMASATPISLQGERLIWDPIAVIPGNPNERLEPASRINFGSVHTVHHNVPVRDIGIVNEESLLRLGYIWSRMQS